MTRNTLPGIEALAALAQFGTVSEAATRLRLTQSAVTKRLQALQRARPLLTRKTVNQAERFTALRFAIGHEARAHFEATRGR